MDGKLGTTPPVDSLYPLSTERFLYVALSTARALETLHRISVHGDLRPANIRWCDEAGHVELLAPQHNNVLTAESLPYVAPERVGRTTWLPDARTDLYSLGVTFYQVLAGRLPFVGRDAVEWSHCHVARKPAPLDEAVPEAIAAIVMRLLAKAPEDRYQTARGLVCDLKRCLEQLVMTKSCALFPLGEHDISSAARVPRGIYGREHELGVLEDALSLVRQPSSPPAVVFMTGPAGIGKSALVRAFYPKVLDAGGIVLSGKPDQLEPGAPYAILRDALAQLCDRILTEPKETLERWRARILALGPSAQMVIDICPRLELALGALPPREALPAPETRTRLAMLFQQLLASAASAQRPLVLVLDDTQWIDAGSIELLLYALRHPKSKNVLVVASFRDEEVAADHPLHAARAELASSGVASLDVDLRPLNPAAITALVGDTFHVADSEAEWLANVVQRRTGGNPLFVSEVIAALQRDGAIAFDHAAARWSFDHRAVETAALADNLVGLVSKRLDPLPRPTRDALSVAACLGSEIEGRILETVLLGSVHDVLAPAVDAGLIYRWGDAYWFAHDQVQRAAYALVPSEGVAVLHADIARRLLAAADVTSDDVLFLIANQLRRGAREVSSTDEALQWAKIQSSAGARAMATAAFHAAAGYLATGAELLGDRGWVDNFELVHRIVAARSQAEHLAGNADEAERLCDLLLARSQTPLDKQVAYRRKIEVLFGRSQAAKAVEVCVEGLAALGMPIPLAAKDADVEAEIAAIEQALGDRRIEDLVDLPAMQLSEMRAAIELLSVTSPAAWYVNEALSKVMLARMVRLSIVHGNVDASAMGYVSFGIVLIARRGDYRRAHAFGRLGYELGRRVGAYWSGMVENIFGAMIAVWARPLRECLDHTRRSLATTTQSGNVQFVAYNCSQIVLASLACGRPIDDVYREAEQLLQTARAVRSEPTILSIESALAFMRAMRGTTENVAVLSSPDFDEAAFTARIAAGDVPLPVLYHHLHKLKAALFAHDVADAIAASEVVMPLAPALGSQYALAEAHFYTALAHLAARDAETARRHAAPIATWAEACPENFLAMHLLVGAELARVSGSSVEAMRLYEQAIAAARAHELHHLDGLANELAAMLHIELGLVTAGSAYVRHARAAYGRWGARGKVSDLERRHASVVGEQRGVALDPSANLDQLDAVTVVKAARVISSELVVERLSTALLHLAVEHAGADFGMFFTCDDRETKLVATAIATSEGIAIETRTDRASEIPWSIVHFVQRTRESLVLDDPAEVAAFAVDTALQQTRPRSVFCLPLVRSAGIVGVLYLTNSLVRGAFTPAKRVLLEVLSGHAITALENARLYDQLQRFNAELETRVVERTAELRQANHELEAFSYSVSHDLKAPLRLVEWSAKALERELGADIAPSAAEALAQVRRGNSTMQQMIDDMLGLWSVTSTEMRHEDVDIGKMAREILDDLAKTDPDRVVEVVVCDRARAEGDPRLLRIALENLLHNAWKFTAKQPRARVEIGTLAGEPPTLFVRDDGAGFDMADAAKLFTPFSRLHDATAFPGTGLGLATVSRIVRLHGGRVWAEGKIDDGATFYFTL